MISIADIYFLILSHVVFKTIYYYSNRSSIVQGSHTTTPDILTFILIAMLLSLPAMFVSDVANVSTNSRLKECNSFNLALPIPLQKNVSFLPANADTSYHKQPARRLFS